MNATLPKLAISAADYFAAKLAYEITPYGLNMRIEKGLKDMYILDVRSTEDFAKGFIPCAVNIPLADLSAKLATLPKDKTIVTYCGNSVCSLAPKAALALAEKGFTVMQLSGGFATWMEKGFKVSK